ncbi:hypothetical protein BDB00DRAFT_874288 [Zychaea mexicana]|uniref:uncharacterized protein n=1 Tax=Zychaea mexicana TaxID=64656 RepID=UPI0022FE1866|nr:uncharacterized protein BDB00DRAFT_874288 [Zychaea mexicana]KAI9491550.1 hypothetical protein BDB00DRAFT_874288 [Zychaea mexicana]
MAQPRGEQQSDTSSGSTASVSRNATVKEAESSLSLAVSDTDSHESQAASAEDAMTSD